MKGLRFRWWLLTVLVIGVVVGLFLAVDSRGGAERPPGRVVDVSYRDFKIRVPHPTVSAGTIVLRVHNAGPSTHEFNVDRTDTAADSLPIQSDGLTVNEDAPSLHRVGSIEEITLGTTEDLKLMLSPGHYVIYCNLEGHYLGGMHASFEVTAR